MKVNISTNQAATVVELAANQEIVKAPMDVMPAKMHIIESIPLRGE